MNVVVQALGKIADQYQLPVQSHLSESQGEIAWVRELHPGQWISHSSYYFAVASLLTSACFCCFGMRFAECSSYTDVYRTYGLLHERAYFAHCCHCGGDEQEMLKAHEAGYVPHCQMS